MYQCLIQFSVKSDVNVKSSEFNHQVLAGLDFFYDDGSFEHSLVHIEC